MAKSRSRKLADLLSGSSELLTADRLDVSGNGTSGQVLQSDGDGSFSWADFAASFFGRTITVSSDTTLTSDDSGAMVVVTSSTSGVKLPAKADGLVFGLTNESGGQIPLIAGETGTYIGDFLKSVFIPDGSEAIVTCDGTKWRVLFTDEISSVSVKDLSTGTYTPSTLVSGFFVGVTGGGGSNTNNGSGGASGGGYAEKFISSPSGSYTVVVGAAGGGQSSFNGTGAALVANGGGNNGTNTGHTSPGTGSGGTYNRSGGSGGNGGNSHQTAGGGGASGSRAENIGSGGTWNGNRGGRHSDNNATGIYALDSSLINTGYNGINVGPYTGNFIAGSGDNYVLGNVDMGGGGATGGQYNYAIAYEGQPGSVVIVEFY